MQLTTASNLETICHLGCCRPELNFHIRVIKIALNKKNMKPFRIDSKLEHPRGTSIMGEVLLQYIQNKTLKIVHTFLYFCWSFKVFSDVWFMSFGKSFKCRIWCWMLNIYHCYLFNWSWVLQFGAHSRYYNLKRDHF